MAINYKTNDALMTELKLIPIPGNTFVDSLWDFSNICVLSVFSDELSVKKNFSDAFDLAEMLRFELLKKHGDWLTKEYLKDFVTAKDISVGEPVEYEIFT